MRSLLLISFLFASPAFAGFLRMSSSSSLMLAEKESQLWIVGEYVIENQGDEAAKDVYPSLRIDEWTWEFEKRSLAAGEKSSWKISEKIPASKLCHEATEFCVRAWPLHGDIFARVDKNYQDQNSYPFSTPEVLSLSLEKNEKIPTGSDLVTATLKIKVLNENEFQGDYSLKNKVDENLKLGLHFLFPKEVSLSMARLPMEINAKGDLHGTFYFKNLTGLKGSDYLAMLVIEIESQGERRLMWVPSRFKIESYAEAQFKKISVNWSLDKSFFVVMGILMIAGFVFLIFYWEKPRRHLR